KAARRFVCRQSTDAYSLGASPKTSPFSWGSKSSPQRTNKRWHKFPSTETLCDKEGGDDGQYWSRMSTSPKTILPSLNHHLSIDGITEEPYLGNESEDMPSHIIPLLPSREEEKTQISIETSGQCSWMQATFNGVNVMVGVGLLSC
ncbi:hypothetical protein GOP47_0027053, partial [Adiantum capillus-veneris]